MSNALTMILQLLVNATYEIEAMYPSSIAGPIRARSPDDSEGVVFKSRAACCGINESNSLLISSSSILDSKATSVVSTDAVYLWSAVIASVRVLRSCVRNVSISEVRRVRRVRRGKATDTRDGSEAPYLRVTCGVRNVASIAADGLSLTAARMKLVVRSRRNVDAV